MLTFGERERERESGREKERERVGKKERVQLPRLKDGFCYWRLLTFQERWSFTIFASAPYPLSATVSFFLVGAVYV